MPAAGFARAAAGQHHTQPQLVHLFSLLPPMCATPLFWFLDIRMQGGLKTKNVKVLKNMNGRLRPGSITLLLGPPGSGKSVFMQALSGRLQTGDGTRVSAGGQAGMHACTRLSVCPS